MAELFAFQKEDVDRLSTMKAALLANDMGTGKTLIALSALATTSAVVVCPAAVKPVWRNEVSKWRPELTPFLLEGRNSFRWPQPKEVVILNYDILPPMKSVSVPEGFSGTLIADEAHYLKNGSSQRTKRFRAISKDMRKRGLPVWLLTGTPMLNHPLELWHVLYAAGLTWIFYPSIYDHNAFRGFLNLFKARKGYFGGWEFGQPDQTVSTRLRQVMIRRTRREVLPELPGKIYRSVYVEIDKRTKVMCDKLIAKLGEVNLNEAIDLAIQSSRTSTEFEELAAARTALATAKIPYLIDLIETFEEADEPVVVFSAHRAPIDVLTKRSGWRTITGDTSTTNRDRFVAEFQALKLKGIGCTIQAGGIGITLTAAHQVVFVDLDWTPANNLQAEDRLCIAKGQRVHVRRGFIPIEDVRIGDLVLTHCGNWHPITHVTSREHRGLMTEILYSRYGEPLRCSHDHEVLVRRGNDMSWMQACNVLPGDFLVMPRPIAGSYVSTVEIPKEVRGRGTYTNQFGAKQKNGRLVHLPEQVEVDAEFLWTLGLFVAEGFTSVENDKGRFVSFSAHERERPWLEDRIGKVMGRLGVGWKVYTRNASRTIEMRAYSTELAKWFRKMFGHGAHEKAIPPWIMDLPAEQARWFLRGYTDGDGYSRNRQTEWVSVSASVSAQVALLALQCGYAPTLRKCDPAPGGNWDRWIDGYTKVGKPSSASLALWDKEKVYHPVREVHTLYAKRSAKRQRVYDLTVKGDESFVVGMAAVHNCRIGQTKGVIINRIVADHNLDRKLARILIEKKKLLEATSLT